MSNTATVLAFDFGASSGRAIRAVYDGQNLTYEEIHRFENFPIEKDGHLCWDVETLLKEIHTAIQKAGTFDSLGFDTWGVDFGLLDADGHPHRCALSACQGLEYAAFRFQWRT